MQEYTKFEVSIFHQRETPEELRSKVIKLLREHFAQRCDSDVEVELVEYTTKEISSCRKKE